MDPKTKKHSSLIDPRGGFKDISWERLTEPGAGEKKGRAGDLSPALLRVSPKIYS